jgi:hypothetical protein
MGESELLQNVQIFHFSFEIITLNCTYLVGEAVTWWEKQLLFRRKKLKQFFNTFLVNKTNRSTECQFYWHYDSTCFEQPFCPSSGVLSRKSPLVHFMHFDDRLLPEAGCSL